MGNFARLGVLCLMALAIAVARLVEVEFRPEVNAPKTALVVGEEAEPAADPRALPESTRAAVGYTPFIIRWKF